MATMPDDILPTVQAKLAWGFGTELAVQRMGKGLFVVPSSQDWDELEGSLREVGIRSAAMRDIVLQAYRAELDERLR